MHCSCTFPDRLDAACVMTDRKAAMTDQDIACQHAINGLGDMAINPRQPCKSTNLTSQSRIRYRRGCRCNLQHEAPEAFLPVTGSSFRAKGFRDAFRAAFRDAAPGLSAVLQRTSSSSSGLGATAKPARPGSTERPCRILFLPENRRRDWRR